LRLESAGFCFKTISFVFCQKTSTFALLNFSIMKSMLLRLILCVAISALFNTTHLRGQIVYAYARDLSSSSYYFVRIDLSDCSWCPVYEPALDELFEGGGYVVHPNGSIIAVSYVTGLTVFTPPSATPVSTLNLPAGASGIAISPSGTVYFTSVLGGNVLLYTYDIVTNTATLVGNLPFQFPYHISNLFFWNGQLYGGTIGQPTTIYQINLANPSASTIFSTIPGNAVNILEVPGLGLLANYDNDLFNLYTVNIVTGVPTPLCNFQPNLQVRYLATWPAGTPELPCLCLNNAGTISNIATNVCTDTDVNILLSGVVVYPNEVLQYILCTDQANPLGSIVAINTTGNFAFNPAIMQINTPYYVVAVSGNELPNGNVDPNDPCLDFSNTMPLTWRTRPAVSFSAVNPTVCGGQCTEVQVNFTGLAPFIMNYATPFGNFSEIFSDNQGTIQVCPPVGTPAGPLQVQATVVANNFCVCN
jgi:hypothetical protein